MGSLATSRRRHQQRRARARRTRVPSRSTRAASIAVRHAHQVAEIAPEGQAPPGVLLRLGRIAAVQQRTARNWNR